MQKLRAILEAMEAVQRRAPDTGDVSNAESEEVEVKEAAGENVAEEIVAGDNCTSKSIQRLTVAERTPDNGY
jgi:hypothetical protein